MFTLNPIHHHCGPGNAIKLYDSDDPVDNDCRKHDLDFNEIGYPEAYTHFSQADQQFIDKMDRHPGILPFFYGSVFKFKKLIAPKTNKQVSFQMVNAGAVPVTPRSTPGRGRSRTKKRKATNTVPYGARKSSFSRRSRSGSRKRKAPTGRSKSTFRGRRARRTTTRVGGYTGPVVNKSGPARVYAGPKLPRDPKFWVKWKACPNKAEMQFFTWDFYIDTLAAYPLKHGYIPITEKRNTVFSHDFGTRFQYEAIIQGGEDKTSTPMKHSIWAAPNLPVYKVFNNDETANLPFLLNTSELFLFKEMSITYRFTNTGKLPLAITVIDFMCTADTQDQWNDEFHMEYTAQQVFKNIGTNASSPLSATPTYIELLKSNLILQHIKGTKSWKVQRRQEIMLNNEDPDVTWKVEHGNHYYDGQKVLDNGTFTYLKNKTVQTVFFVHGVLGRTTTIKTDFSDTDGYGIKATALTGGEMNVVGTWHVKGARYALTGRTPKTVLWDDLSMQRISNYQPTKHGDFGLMSFKSQNVGTYEQDESFVTAPTIV